MRGGGSDEAGAGGAASLKTSTLCRSTRRAVRLARSPTTAWRRRVCPVVASPVLHVLPSPTPRRLSARLQACTLGSDAHLPFSFLAFSPHHRGRTRRGSCPFARAEEPKEKEKTETSPRNGCKKIRNQPVSLGSRKVRKGRGGEGRAMREQAGRE